MSRRAHYIKDNKVSEYPQQAIWFDTETKQDKLNETTLYHTLNFGWLCYMRRHRDGIWSDEDWYRFTTRSAFWEYVVSHVRDQSKLYLFCHNTSFDLPVLDVFNSLPNYGYTLRTAIIDAPPTILRFRNGSKCIMILDTLNIWRMPLKYLGKEIGLDKLEMPEDNDLGISWDTYGRRDVEIIRNACLLWWTFLETNDMGSFAPTLAGQAMRIFRHKYMRHKIFIDTNEKALKLTREGYYGGRTECFRIGRYRDSFSLLDFNSHYPATMAYNQFPCKLLSHTVHPTMDLLQTWLTTYSVCARVVLRTNIPFCPIRDRHKLLFPVGEFQAVLSTPEITYALANAEILEVLEAAVYEKAFLFTEYMLDFYKKRLDAKVAGQKVEAFIYRKLINSFYGKWGQDGAKWKEQENIEDLKSKRWFELNADTGEVTWYRQLGGLIQRKLSDNESLDSFPAVAGHVTAHARMELWSIIQQAGLEHVYYCDTDSVLVDSVGRRNLEFRMDSSKLGGLSLKGEYDDIEIWSAKDYRFGDKSKTKGVRRDAEWIDTHTVRQCQWSGLRGMLASGVLDKPITKTIIKHLNRSYDKGTVLSDGRVQPHLILPE